MFVKITASGPRRYVQLVESYRDESGRVKKRTVATLGRVDQLAGELDSVINGLMKVSGRTPADDARAAITFESARALGDVWTLTELWHSLGFDELRRIFRRTRHAIDVEALIRLMVFNRLCDPDSKLGVLRWLETVALPRLGAARITHQHLLRAMDALMDHQAALDDVLARLLRPLIDQDLSVVFYDLTTIRAAGLSTEAADVRRHGMSKEGVVARQFLLGVVQTAQGLPIHHEVFDGNAAETKTLVPTLKTILERFPSVRRLVLVADRGLLSLDNLEALSQVRLAHGQMLEFILAVPARRYGEFTELLAPLHASQCRAATQEVTGEIAWNGLRLIVAHDPERAAEQGARRSQEIDALVALADQWADTLDGQDAGARRRGRKLSDGGARARLFHAVAQARLSQIIRVDLAGELFSYRVDERALGAAQMMDGKLVLVSNVVDLTPREIVCRYKALADIERGFRVLKSELEIAPVYHRLPERIRAHATICFLALILHRVMRWRLKAAGCALSPDRALELLGRIQHHRVRLGGAAPVAGVSSISTQQAQALAALQIRKPVLDEQLTLL